MAIHRGYEPGTWLAVCDACGELRRNTELRAQWDGFMVCADRCWLPRQPQDFLFAVPDGEAVPWARPNDAAEADQRALNLTLETEFGPLDVFGVFPDPNANQPIQVLP